MPLAPADTTASAAEDLLQAVFALSPTGLALLRPVWAASGDITDFTYSYLNPAAQRLLRLPERPAAAHQATYLEATATLDFYRAAFQSGQPAHAAAAYPPGGPAAPLQVAAHRSGELLVLSLSPAFQAQQPIEEVRAPDEELPARNNERQAAPAPTHATDQTLEAQVADRTQALTQALHAAEHQGQRLAAQQQLLHQLLREVPAAVAALDGPDHRYSFVNARYQELVAQRAQLGLPIAEVLPELVALGFDKLLDQVYATGETRMGTEALVELRDPATDGVFSRYVNFVYQPLLTEQGRPHGVLAFILDVSESVRSRQRAEEAQAQALAAAERLAQQRETYYRIFEQTPAAIAILRGPGHRLDYYNPAYGQFFLQGLALGRTIAEQQPEAVAHGFVALLDRVLETGETYFGYEHRLDIQQTNGRPPRSAYFDFTYQVFEEDGRPAGISVFANEVTERVLARQQHEAQQQVLQRVFEQAPVAMGVFAGPQHIVEVCNPGLQAIWGRTAEQVIGKPLHEAVPEFQGQGFDKLLTEVMRTGTPYIAQELPLQVRHAGEMTTVYVNFVYQPLRDADGAITAVAAVATDISEQVRARQASEATTRQLQLLTDALPVLISYVDQDERYQFANYGYEAWFGQKPEELLGRPVREVVGEAAYQGAKPYLDRAQAGERVDFETHMAYRPDFVRHIRTSYVPDVRAGQVQGVYALVLDITDQVQARAEAEQQRAVLHTLFMSAPAAICIFAGPDLVYELVNPTYQRIFPGRELLGRPLLEALPELAGRPTLARLREVYRTGEAAEFQEVVLHVARTAGGPPEEAFFTFTFQPRRDAGGTVDGVLVFAYEVTDQVLARRVVERSEQYLRRIADALPAIIWLTDPAGQCTYLNRQWHDYTAQPLGEGLGEGWFAMVHPADEAAARTIFFDAIAQQAPFSVLYRLRRRDGRYRWVLDTGAPRFDWAGEFDGFVGTLFDINEQKQTEQVLQRLTTSLRLARDQAQSLNTDLQASNEQLRRTNVDLDNFIYTASHDLKAPITNIEGLAHALHDQLPATGALAEAVAPLLGMMQQSIERFQRTLDHLSDVTKLQKEYDQPLAEVPLGTVVAEVCLDLQPLLHSSAAHLETDVGACPTVAFSAKNLRSVVYNLLSNALKYRDPARPLAVRISCHPAGGYQVLQVQDNGLGLDAGQQAELFTMFRRFHVGVEGSGIGLYMVKKVVENAGGKIEVTSEPGVGSVFSVYFRR
jgi:PAS domain S-box-containing protein